MGAKGVTVWTPEQLKAVLKRNPQISGAMIPPPFDPKAIESPAIVTQRKKMRKMTRAEEEWGQHLRRIFANCEVKFEAYTLKLADDTRYVPDYSVCDQGGRLTFYEVKGAHIFSRSLNKPKVAAAMFRHRFIIAQRRKDGTWEETTLNGKIDT